MLIWFNRSVGTRNNILKNLNITSLRSIVFFNKFGFKIDALNPNLSFLIM